MTTRSLTLLKFGFLVAGSMTLLACLPKSQPDAVIPDEKVPVEDPFNAPDAPAAPKDPFSLQSIPAAFEAVA